MDAHSMGQAAEGPQAPAFLRLPAELRALRQWCVTRGTADDKAPRTVDGQLASPTDPSNWTDFDTACRCAAERNWLIGFVFTANDPFAFVDLDVKEDTPPEQLARFESIIQNMASYTERSRSGAGFHIIVRGNIGKGRRRDGVEIYSQERFMVCTGNVHFDAPVAERQAMLDNMVAQMPKAETEQKALDGPPDVEWSLAELAANDTGLMGKLFAGDWKSLGYPSQSEADLALVKLMLPHSESPNGCWETFKLSALGKREKAQKRRGYALSTMALAIQHADNDAEQVRHGQALAEAMGLTPQQAAQRGFFWPPPPHNPAHFRLLSDDDLARMPKLRWLVKGIVPDKGIGTIYGQSKTYKSFLTLDLLAHITNGQPWFGKKVIAAPAVYVPFEGLGGVPNRVDAWRRAHRGQSTNMRFITDPMNLRQQADRDKLVATLTANGWAGGVLCIDTLAQAGIGIDENTSQGMGEMIGIFQELQQRLGGVVLVVHHSGKSEKAGMRGHSSLQGALDFAIHCWRDDEWPKYEGQFVLDKVKEGKDELWFNFRMEPFHLGEDDDGDPITSLTLHPTPEETASAPSESAIAAEDDAFVDRWVRKVMLEGTHPTGRWLESQLVHVKAERNLTQKRLRDAIARLKGVGKLEDTPGGPSGAKWLRAVDVMPSRGINGGVR